MRVNSILFLGAILFSFQVSGAECSRVFEGLDYGPAVRLTGTFGKAFSTSNWKGSLDQRMQMLQKKYPKLVSILKDAKFKTVRGKPKRVVVIDAKKGVPPKFLSDYLNAVSGNTVSFPLDPGAGHLYSRFGSQVVAVYGSYDQSDYRLPNYSDRIEPLIELTHQEMKNLSVYLNQIAPNPSEVLGQSNYSGVASGKTNGKLEGNQPTDSSEGHNCTSWICLAPIGADSGESLLSLVGGNISREVHTNPGWWSKFLATMTGNPRAQTVVLWRVQDENETDYNNRSRKPRITPAGTTVIPWDFGEH